MQSISYYNDFLSSAIKKKLLNSSQEIPEIPGLFQVGENSGLESIEALRFLVELYKQTNVELNLVLNQRIKDRKFLDERVMSCSEFNKEYKKNIQDLGFQSVLGLEDSNGRIVIGPHNENYCKKSEAKKIAPIPSYLEGSHVTLFGPPDSAKMSINAMNAYHREIKNEPSIIKELLKLNPQFPKWGADDEDSKTPLRADLVDAGINLSGCFNKSLRIDGEKVYELEDKNLALPIKRFPGLALPSFFLFYENEPIPLHLYDFALHLFKHWKNEEALVFYVPKLENEEEAKYIKNMIVSAESLIKKMHSEYKLGSVRLMIVLENPRAVFRVNEIMDELYPFFAGASLGWHDYLASTARLFKEDSSYRIPVKADPDIVIKYIKASHDLLAQVVGPRGGIKVGGMYGILPNDTDLKSKSFQVTMRGFIKDVITQMKRDLTGYWVAHPDFVRIGLALVSAWKIYLTGDKSKLDELVKSLLNEKYYLEVMSFISGPDIDGLDVDDPLYARSLIVADIGESNIIANNDPREIRYNVFQSLQYLTDWLCGNGCVALPSTIDGESIRIMDDLATAERSRWEVWHELYHDRFSIDEFLQIAHEELMFIRKDLSNSKKIVEVKWNEKTSKWYPVAFNIMVSLMTNKKTVEFATELLLPFTIEDIRKSENPWLEASKWDCDKFKLDPYIKGFNYYFERCGELIFAKSMAKDLISDFKKAQEIIMNFNLESINSAASFHGNIGENKKTLDPLAQREQEKVGLSNRDELLKLGNEYKEKFSFKFLVSAIGKSSEELKKILIQRLSNSKDEEIENAKKALFEITIKRIEQEPLNKLKKNFDDLAKKFNIKASQIALSSLEQVDIGDSHSNNLFQIASLSKTLGTYIALNVFKKNNVSIYSKVSDLISEYKIAGECSEELELWHLMSHLGLNMHYVNGIKTDIKMPSAAELFLGSEKYNYEKILIKNSPGSKFSYSGAGFIILELILEKLENKSFEEISSSYLNDIELSFTKDKNINKVLGQKEDGSEIVLNFPSIAAGAWGTARGMMKFLEHLSHSYSNKNDPKHDHVVRMFYGVDKGCKEFMHANIGLGVFVLDAQENKFILHQGANDGFRAIYLYCFSGPDCGKGFTVLSTGELNAVLFISEVSKLILKEYEIQGIDFEMFNNDFNLDNVSSEQVVNIGYKELFLKAFLENLPEKISDKGDLYFFHDKNLFNNCKILKVSNQSFARAENLISNYEPIFDPELFGKQGKIMDSWESARHNQEEFEFIEFELDKITDIKQVYFSTKFHLGNQVSEVSIEAKEKLNSQWEIVLKKSKVDGHFQCMMDLDTKAKYIKIKAYPDGGLSRMALFSKRQEFNNLGMYSEKIPSVKKSLHLPFDERLSFSKPVNCEFNVASSVYGAKVIFSSNEHYAPASQIISPFKPIDMFDGFESARSRNLNHHEKIIIKLDNFYPIHKIEIDFTYFINNNPREIEIKEIIERENVKAFAGNIKTFIFAQPKNIDELEVLIYPDGGINRIRAYTK